jgi:REP element-mobilizing transposase RayT
MYVSPRISVKDIFVGNGRDRSGNLSRRLLKDRKLIRLKDYDYSSEGLYFITICTNSRINYFGEINNFEMKLNTIGEIVQKQWEWLAKQYKYIILDHSVVMPNHFHGILYIINDSNSPVKIKPLSELIGAFKTTSSKKIHEEGVKEFKWQKSFFDRIIRTEKELNNIRHYIACNPAKWEMDSENPDCREIHKRNGHDRSLQGVDII